MCVRIVFNFGLSFIVFCGFIEYGEVEDYVIMIGELFGFGQLEIIVI